MTWSRHNAYSRSTWTPKPGVQVSSGFCAEKNPQNYHVSAKKHAPAHGKEELLFSKLISQAAPQAALHFTETPQASLSALSPDEIWKLHQRSKGNKCSQGSNARAMPSLDEKEADGDCDKDSPNRSRLCSSSTASDISGAEHRSNSPDSGCSELEPTSSPLPTQRPFPSQTYDTRARLGSDADVDAMSQRCSAHVEAVLSAVMSAETKRSSTHKEGNSWLAECSPSTDELSCVERCVQALNTIAKGKDPTWRVLPFGSHVSGLALRRSDLDATVIVPESSQEDSPGGCSAVSILQEALWPVLKTHKSFTLIEQVFGAKVPIIKLRFEDILDVDLSVHNRRPLENTGLIKAYANVHPSVRELILAVKVWAKAANVCGATEGKLSCYTFTLMAIYYMQVDWLINMPCLHTKAFDLVSDKPPGDLHPSWVCPVPLSLLLDRFFMFYAEVFGWGDEVVSVRLGRRVESNCREFSYLPHRMTRRIHIEDPYDLKRNLHCVLGPKEEMDLRAAFAEASGLAHGMVSSFKHDSSVSNRPAAPCQASQVSEVSEASEVSEVSNQAAQHKHKRSSRKEKNRTDDEAADKPPEDEDFKWWFAFGCSCCVYTSYAMYCGQLFRLAIAMFVLIVVLFSVERHPGSAAKRPVQQETTDVGASKGHKLHTGRSRSIRIAAGSALDHAGNKHGHIEDDHNGEKATPWKLKGNLSGFTWLDGKLNPSLKAYFQNKIKVKNLFRRRYGPQCKTGG